MDAQTAKWQCRDTAGPLLREFLSKTLGEEAQSLIFCNITNMRLMITCNLRVSMPLKPVPNLLNAVKAGSNLSVIAGGPPIWMLHAYTLAALV